MPKGGVCPKPRWLAAWVVLFAATAAISPRTTGAEPIAPVRAFVAGAGAVSAVATDSEGRVYVAGRTQPGGGKLFLRAFLPSGKQAWATTPTAPSAGYDNASGRLVVDAASRAYLCTRSHAFVSAGSQFSIECHSAIGGLTWQLSSQTPSNAVFGLALDPVGSIIAVGSASFSLGFSGQLVGGPPNYGFLARVSREGLVVAIQPLAGEPATADGNAFSQCLDVAADPEGRVVICGTLLGTTSFGGINIQGSQTQHQVFIAALDPTGRISWVTLLPVTYPTSEAAYQDSLVPRVRLGASGEVYVGLTDSARRGYVAGLSPRGQILWSQSLSGTVAGLVVNREGNLFCAGSYSGRLTAGSMALTNAGVSDVFLLQLSPDGQVIWGKRGGGPNDDQCRDLALDPAGNPLVAGSFVESTRFGDIVLSSGGTSLAGFVATFGASVVPALPVILSQPSIQEVLPGETATFQVSVTGAPPFRYAWRFNGTNIDGATNPIFSVSRALLANSGVYDVIVSNPNGVTASTRVPLTILPGTPLFGDFFAARGTLVGFTSEASGTNLFFTRETRDPLVDEHQGGHSGWLTWTAPDDGTCTLDTLGSSFDTMLGVFSGSTLVSLQRIASNDDADAGVPQSRLMFQAVAGTPYQIMVDGRGAAAVGQIAFHLGFSNAAPLVLVPPLDQRTTPGADVLWTVTAVGVEPLAFQWRRNGTNIPNATESRYLIRGAQRPDGALYDVVVSSGSGSVTSAVARLTGLLPPQILSITVDRRPISGTATTLQVTASGAEPMTYQWQFQGANIAGATHATLALPLVSPATAGTYGVVVSNVDGSVTSAVVSLTVTYQVAALVDSGGSVVRVPDHDRYDLGDVVQVTAVPSPGFGFAGWTGNLRGKANPTMVTVASNTVAAPLFTPLVFVLGTEGVGRISLSPDSAIHTIGESVQLSAAAGRWYRFDRWSDGVLALTRTVLVGLTNRYTAVFLPTQPLETVTLGGIAREAPVGMPSVIVDGEFITNAMVSRLGQAEVRLATTFPGATILYTLDGTPPGFSSILYRGPFRVATDVTVRATAFREDVVTEQEGDPVDIHVTPARWLTLHTDGGGDVTATPLPGLMPRGAEVVLHATPWPGWQFVQWLGDAAGTNEDLALAMDEGKEITGVFATGVATQVRGQGSIVMSPSGGVVEYGGRVRLSALPSPGNYFAFWAGPLSEVVNPVSLEVTSAQPRVVGVFVPLSPGEVSLSIASDGPGVAGAKSGANRFRQGQTVTLVAVADPGAVFDGWSLASLGSDNPAILTLDRSYTLTARFHRTPVLRVIVGAFRDEDGRVPVEIAGDPGMEYGIETASAVVGPWTFRRSLRLIGGRGQFDMEVPPGTGSQFLRVRR